MKFSSLIRCLLLNVLAFTMWSAHAQSDIRPSILLDSARIAGFCTSNNISSDACRRTLQFYREREFALSWFLNGELVPHASLLVNTIESQKNDALDFPDSVTTSLTDSLAVFDGDVSIQEATETAKWIDVALTVYFFDFFPKLWNGKVDPRAEREIRWHISGPDIKYSDALDSILSDLERENPFVDYRRLHDGFFALQQLLSKYRKTKSSGGWTAVKEDYLRRGDSGKGVYALATRLHESGDLEPENIDSTFTRTLERAVKTFQMRHGLRPDGIVGPRTIAELNVSVDERIRQIIVNMERWRWIEPITSEKYVLVNIPEFQLYGYENSKAKMEMPVIIGKEASETVVFNDKIKYIVVNPYWNIPKSIASEEMLPKVQEDENYLRDRQIEVGINGEYDRIDADTIQWQEITADNFPFTLRQKPGEMNQLGTIKFIFPNKYAIYLHDTPNRNLFDRHDRRLSHGCVRVAQPFKLADFLLNNADGISGKKIERMVRKGEEDNVWIPLSKPVPVYLVYFTTWVDKTGTAHFREDIYGHDSDVMKMLFSGSRQ